MQIGLHSVIGQTPLIQAQMDDDVDTDEDIMANALHTCLNDVHEAVAMYKRFGQKRVLNVDLP